MSKKQKIILIICAVATTIIVALAIYTGVFFHTTVADMEKVCVENSTTNATEFELWGEISLDASYRFGIPLNGNEKEQELFIFKEKPFGFIKSTKRYELIYQSQNSKSPVGSLMFKFENTENNTLIFYSKNSDHISDITSVTSKYVNGRAIEKTTKYDFSPEEAFIIFTEELEEYEQIIDFTFSNDNGIVYSY